MTLHPIRVIRAIRGSTLLITMITQRRKDAKENTTEVNRILCVFAPLRDSFGIFLLVGILMMRIFPESSLCRPGVLWPLRRLRS
jgi:hypothetical protein